MIKCDLDFKANDIISNLKNQLTLEDVKSVTDNGVVYDIKKYKSYHFHNITFIREAENGKIVELNFVNYLASYKIDFLNETIRISVLERKSAVFNLFKFFNVRKVNDLMIEIIKLVDCKISFGKVMKKYLNYFKTNYEKMDFETKKLVQREDLYHNTFNYDDLNRVFKDFFPNYKISVKRVHNGHWISIEDNINDTKIEIDLPFDGLYSRCIGDIKLLDKKEKKVVKLYNFLNNCLTHKNIKSFYKYEDVTNFFKIKDKKMNNKTIESRIVSRFCGVIDNIYIDDEKIYNLSDTLLKQITNKFGKIFKNNFTKDFIKAIELTLEKQDVSYTELLELFEYIIDTTDNFKDLEFDVTINETDGYDNEIWRTKLNYFEKITENLKNNIEKYLIKK